MARRKAAKGGAGTAERERLVELAGRLEGMASNGEDPTRFDALLGELNGALQTGLSRRDLEVLYQSQTAAELVDAALERRAALPGLSRSLALGAEEIPGFLAARSGEHYAHAAGYDELQRDLDSLAPHTALPRNVVAQLLESALPAADRAAFLLGYGAPESVESAWETARALGRAMQGEASPRGAVAVDLLEWELARHPHEELQKLWQLAKRQDIKLKAVARRLGLLG